MGQGTLVQQAVHVNKLLSLTYVQQSYHSSTIIFMV